MTTYTREELFERLVKDLGEFQTKTVKDTKGKDVTSLLYYPKHEGLKTLLYPGRVNWFTNRKEIARTYRGMAILFIGKATKDNRPAVVNNYVELMRRAHILETWPEEAGFVEVDGLDLHLLTGKLIEKDVIKADFSVIFNEGRHDGKMDFRQNDPKAEEERQKREKANKAIQQKAAFSFGSSKWHYAVLFVSVFVVALGLAWLFRGQLSSLMGIEQPSFYQVDPVQNTTTTPGLGAETVGTPGVSLTETVTQPTTPVQAPLSSDLLKVKIGFTKIFAMMTQMVMAAIVFLMIFTSFKVFLDRQAGGNPKDFQLFVYGIFGFAVWCWLPLAEYFFPGQFITALGKYEITLRVVQNTFGIMAFLIYLVAVSADGIADFTPLSAGLYIAGWILFLGKPDEFMLWSPPTSTIVCWILSVVVHYAELVRQSSVIIVTKFVVAGIAAQMFLFFLIFTGLETAQTLWMLNYAQLIAFITSMGFVLGLVGFGLTWLSKSKVLPQNGAMTGRFVGAVDTAAHDAAILLAIWGGVFLLIFWV